MLFVVFALDKPGVKEKRAAVMQAHREYLEKSPVKNLTSGPLVSDDGEDVIGSLYILEAKDRAQMDEFQKNDPLFQADIWRTVEVRAYNKRVGEISGV